MKGKGREGGRKKKTYRLGAGDGAAAGVGAHAREGAEGVVGEDVDAAVVGLEVVNLLAEHEHPQVLAYELDRVQRVVEPGAVA